MDKLLLKSPTYEIVDRVHTQAKYIKDFKLGDTIQWNLESYKLTGYNQSRFTVYINGKKTVENLASNILDKWLRLLTLKEIN